MEKKDFRLGQRLQIVTIKFQIGAGITNQCRKIAKLLANCNKADKSRYDDWDSGATDNLTSDSRANGKFTVLST